MPLGPVIDDRERLRLLDELDQLRKRAAEIERATGVTPSPEFVTDECAGLGTVVNHAPVVFWAVDSNGVFTLSEGKGLQALGLKSGESVGRSVYEMYRDMPNSLDVVRRAFAGEIVTRVVELNGVFFDTWQAPLHNAMGEVSGVIGVATDITQHVRVEAALRDRENLFHGLARLSPVAIFRTDCDGICLYVNERWYEITGSEPERPMHQCWIDSAIAEDQPRLASQWLSCRKLGMELRAEFRILRPNGDLRWVFAQVASLGERGEPATGFVGTLTDITTRKRDEESLRRAHDDLEQRVQERTAELLNANDRLREMVARNRETQIQLANSEERWRRLVEFAPDMIFIVSLEGDFLFANRAVPQPQGPVVGRNAYEFLTGEHSHIFRNACERVLATGEPTSYELQAASADGPRWYRTNMGPIRLEDKIEQFLLIVTDITERRKAEGALEAERKHLQYLLDVHERDRKLTAYEIHDGLVQHVTGALMLLESMTQKPPLKDQVPEHYDLVLRALRTTIQEGRRMIHGLRPPIIDELGVAAAIDYLANEHREAGLVIEIDHDEEIGRFDPLVESMLFRIAQESLTNLRRHSKATKAWITLRHVGSDLELTIRDNGIGFDPKQVTEHRYGLKGLRDRASFLRGTATIESKPGQGTTVCVRLPLASVQPKISEGNLT